MVISLRRGEPPRKAIVRLVVAFVVVTQITALAGDLSMAWLVDHYPSLLIALNPRNRNLILVTNQLDPAVYYLVGFFRLILSDPIYYLLGFWYGQRALSWVERRSPTFGPVARDSEKFFKAGSYPLIFFAPNNLICAAAAATGVPLRAFIALNLSGTITRLVLIRQLGAAFQSPITWVLDLIKDNRLIIFGLSAVLVAWMAWQEFRNDPMGLPDELDDDEDQGPDSGAAQQVGQPDAPESSADSPSAPNP